MIRIIGTFYSPFDDRISAIGDKKGKPYSIEIFKTDDPNTIIREEAVDGVFSSVFLQELWNILAGKRI